MKTPVITRLAYWRAGGVFALGALAAAPGIAMADEGGVSFWLPGLYGSLAATPEQPGWSFANIYYHATVSAGATLRPRASSALVHLHAQRLLTSMQT